MRLSVCWHLYSGSINQWLNLKKCDKLPQADYHPKRLVCTRNWPSESILKRLPWLMVSSKSGFDRVSLVKKCFVWIRNWTGSLFIFKRDEAEGHDYLCFCGGSESFHRGWAFPWSWSIGYCGLDSTFRSGKAKGDLFSWVPTCWIPAEKMCDAFIILHKGKCVLREISCNCAKPLICLRLVEWYLLGSDQRGGLWKTCFKEKAGFSVRSVSVICAMFLMTTLSCSCLSCWAF